MLVSRPKPPLSEVEITRLQGIEIDLEKLLREIDTRPTPAPDSGELPIREWVSMRVREILLRGTPP